MPARKTKLPDHLALMPLRSTIVYPLGVIGVQIGMPSTLEMLANYPQDGLLVGTVIAPGGPDDPIDPHSLEKIGVLARVSDRLNMPGGSVQATMQGVQRVRFTQVSVDDGFFMARSAPAREKAAEESVAQELIARILNALEALSSEVERIPREVPRILRMNLGDPGRFADLVATLANFSVSSKDEILQRLDVKARLQYALEELDGQIKRVRQIEPEGPAVKPPSETEGTPTERAATLREKIQ